MPEHHEYAKGELTEADLLPSPTAMLQTWLDSAEAAGVQEPYAMCVSTVNEAGQPSARFVLLRILDERGLVFFTGYESRKGQELDENPRICATFWWAAMERQVRIEGFVERTSAEESDAYFHSRPRKSQISAASSPQSHVIPDRAELEQRWAEIESLYPEGEIPRPENWGGFRIVPEYFEFWQGRRSRLHDRLTYRKEGDEWRNERLAP